MIDPYVEHMLGREAASVKPEDREALIAQAREREVEQRKYRQRLEALQSGEVLPECEQCGAEFAGRSDARFCSTRCRVAAHRAQKKAEGQETAAEKKARAKAEANEARKTEILEVLERYREDTRAIVLGAKLGEWGSKTNEKILYWLRNAIEDIEAL